MFAETLQVPACSLVAGARCKQRASQCCRTSSRAGKRLQKVRSCGHQGNWVVSHTRTAKLLSSKPAEERNKSEHPSASGVATGAPSPTRETAAVPGGRGAALLRSAVPRAVPCRAGPCRAPRAVQAGGDIPAPLPARGERSPALGELRPLPSAAHPAQPGSARHGPCPAPPSPPRPARREPAMGKRGGAALGGGKPNPRRGVLGRERAPRVLRAPLLPCTHPARGRLQPRSSGSQGFLLPSPLAFGGPPRVKQCRGYVESMGGKAADLGPPGSAVPSSRCPSVGPYGHSGTGTASGFNEEKKGEGKNIHNLITQSKEAARIPLVATWSN